MSDGEEEKDYYFKNFAPRTNFVIGDQISESILSTNEIFRTYTPVVSFKSETTMSSAYRSNKSPVKKIRYSFKNETTSKCVIEKPIEAVKRAKNSKSKHTTLC